MIETGSLAPDSFVNPSLPLYLMLPPVWLQQRLAGWGLLRGNAADPLLVSRALSALAGAAAVALLGAIALRVHPKLGLLPAALLALCPGVVNLCHFATPEAWLLLGTSVTLGLALLHASGRAPAWSLGLALGLTASTKYTAAALLVPALMAVCWRDGRRAPRAPLLGAFAAASGILLVGGAVLLGRPGAGLAAQLRLPDARLLLAESALRFVHGLGFACLATGAATLALAALAWRRPDGGLARIVRVETLALAGTAALGFLIGTPFAAARPREFLSYLAFNDQTRFEYKGLTGHATSFLPYLSLFADALTVPVLAAAGLGLLVAAGRALRGDKAAGILAAGAVAPYLLVAGSGHQALRFLAPALPAAAWLAAVGVAAMPSVATRRFAGGLLLLRAGFGALLVTRLFFVDSRLAATRWLEQHVPPGAVVDVITNHLGYAPHAPAGRPLRQVPVLSREMAPRDRFEAAAQSYAEAGAPWLVLTASYYERFLEHPAQQPERAAFFQRLLTGRGGYRVVARFRQPALLRPNAEFLDPEIVVLRKTPS